MSSGYLIEGSDIPVISPLHNCQFYNIFVNGDKHPSSNVQTGAECGGSTCSCSNWVDQGCGQGTCPTDQMAQTRSCSPQGCNTESRCVSSNLCTVTFEKEDVNRDGEINNTDLQLCLSALLEKQVNPSTFQLADVNQDGLINIIDIQQIVLKINW